MPKETSALANISTEILRGLLSVTVYRATLSCTKKHEVNKTFLGFAQQIVHWNVLHVCCPGGGGVQLVASGLQRDPGCYSMAVQY
jgi:hypothetical protein